MSKFERLNDSNEDKSVQNADLLLKGLQYATSINNTFTLITGMSTDMGKTMTKSSVLSLCHLVELLKAIQMTYHKKKEPFIFTIQNIIQALCNKLLSFVMAAKKRLMSDKKYSEKRLDILSGIVLVANALSGPSKNRIN
jgi:WASH complex subunit 7